MAQVKFRGNLYARVFPFLSSQFGQSVIVANGDQATSYGESAGGDNNIPQAYYMHNVVPTAQGYKSVTYTKLIPDVGISFDRVIPIRDPNMTRGWLGVTRDGKVYIYQAGDYGWNNISDQVGWLGGDVSEAYAGGYTYICFSKYAVFKVDITNKQLIPVSLNGLVSSGVVAITSGAGYLIATDGVTIYWSSTITPEDFVPSLITGAGSGKPNDVEGLIIALVPMSKGFAIYSSVNIVVATYSQNARYPWIFKAADNSKGVAKRQHIAASGEDGTNYVWTSAGLQRVTVTGAATLMAEVTDFLAGKEFEDYNPANNTFTNTYLASPMQVALNFIGARYLIISYGISSFTHALVYDAALKRWGRLKLPHATCFEITVNNDGALTSSFSASAKKTLGFATPKGAVVLCNFDNGEDAKDSVLLLGKYQLTRSRATTLEELTVESVDSTSNFDVSVLTTFDGKSTALVTKPTLAHKGDRVRSYKCRVTGANHTLAFTGRFNLNSFELAIHVNGRR